MKVVAVVAAALVGVASAEDARVLRGESLADQVPAHLAAAPIDAGEVACWKHVSFRGFGHVGNCAQGEVEHMGLCYQECPAGAEAVGPICLSACPVGYDISAGVLCCNNKETCTKDLVDITVKLPYDIAHAVKDESNPTKLIQDLQRIFKDVKELAFKDCNAL